MIRRSVSCRGREKAGFMLTVIRRNNLNKGKRNLIRTRRNRHKSAPFPEKLLAKYKYESRLGVCVAPGAVGGKEENMKVNFERIKNDSAIRTYIEAADASLVALGYTEHSFAHVGRVSYEAARILETLGYDEKTVELARIAGYMHDIGNLVNRDEHSQSGAVMAFRILDRMGMPPEDIATVVTAIGNHDEGTGVPVNAVAAAPILADKSDVRRSRVRNSDTLTFDIHDRVNYSVTDSALIIDGGKIKLSLNIDTEISSIMDYFEIFLQRMTMCRHAAEKLGLSFKLTINEQNFI